MDQVQPLVGNPFALMMNPQDVVQAMEQSHLLGGLNRRVYRPLDRPVIPQKSGRKATPVIDDEADIADEHDLPDTDDAL